MKPLPLYTGTIHIIGIGGIGMSGLAEVLHQSGHRIQGSDQAANANTQRLEKMGIKIFIEHKKGNIEGAHVVVCSSAVKKASNPEVLSAQEHRILILSRSDLLCEMMRFHPTICVTGTHGKTTTTSLMASVLLKAHMSPTVLSGGILVDLNSNAHVGQGEWMVVEADESDQTFIRIPTTLGIITNIEPEHLENYNNDFSEVKRAFLSFANGVPFYGMSVLCLDHPIIQEILPKIEKPYVTYGVHLQADCRAQNIRATPKGMEFDAFFMGQSMTNIYLPLYGHHNVLNALSVIVVSMKLGLSISTIKENLGSFKGIKRRFTIVGKVGGVTIVDDYGHHPTEIKAVLAAARYVSEGKVIAVVQPHRYSRLRDLFKEFSLCFQGADEVVLAPVYAAGEPPLPHIDHLALAHEVQKNFKGVVHVIESESDLPPLVGRIAKEKDYVILLGAGNISQWAYNLPKKLEEFFDHDTI